MVFVGLLAAFAVSLASFSLLTGLTSPQSGTLTIGLFFLTFFLTAASFFALMGMVIKWAVARARVFSGHKNSIASPVHSAWGSNFRRGLLLGAFMTVLVALETFNVLTLEIGMAALAPFALLEAYILRKVVT